MKLQLYFFHAFLLFSLTLACGSGQTQQEDTGREISEEFKQYWMNGEAELSSYHLDQARYGEMHRGNAVLIFVTEDLSRSKQVKLDDPAASPEDAVKVLKLNMTKKFNTGIYPYSMMTSVFSPLEGEEHALKVTTTSQEWCGHTFTQLNLEKGGYEGQLYSYFESEGDKQFRVEKTFLEDELWTRIRINPDQLPVGKVKMVRGNFAARLRHLPVEAEEVEVVLKEEGAERVYSIYYPSDERSLSIRFERNFPYRILSWQETYTSGWGAGAKKLTTTATLNKSIRLDYWRKNLPADSTYRKQLGLE